MPCIVNDTYCRILLKKFGNARNQTSNICSSVGRSTHVARNKHQYCNYYFFIFYNGCCMKYGVDIVVGIFIFELDVKIILYTYFF